MRWILMAVSGAGSISFCLVFLLTFSSSASIESFAAEFVEREALAMIDDRIDALGPPEGAGFVAQAAAKAYAANETRIETMREKLRDRVHEKFVDAIAAIRDVDCACREKWIALLDQSTIREMALLRAANERIVEFVQGTYVRVVTDLKRDLRIFALSNALALWVLLLLLWLKPKARLHLYVPGALLVIAVAICTYGYLFEQNWLLTIIHRDYFGYGYFGYLAIVYAFLCDIALNRAKVTLEVVNLVLSIAGSALRVGPC